MIPPTTSHQEHGRQQASIRARHDAGRTGKRANRLAVALLSLLAHLLIRLLRATVSIRHVGREHLERLERGDRNYIFAFWHGRLLMMPYAYRGKKMRILISRHADGEYIANAMRWFGHGAIRGSTTRGGAAALRAVVRALRGGMDVGFTPDGPRGPRFQVQDGVILAARLGRVPIVPVSFSASRAKIFQSWDRFVLPLPFSRVTLFYGEPIHIPETCNRWEMREFRSRLEHVLCGFMEPGSTHPRDRGGMSAGPEDTLP